MKLQPWVELIVTGCFCVFWCVCVSKLTLKQYKKEYTQHNVKHCVTWKKKTKQINCQIGVWMRTPSSFNEQRWTNTCIHGLYLFFCSVSLIFGEEYWSGVIFFFLLDHNVSFTPIETVCRDVTADNVSEGGWDGVCRGWMGGRVEKIVECWGHCTWPLSVMTNTVRVLCVSFMVCFICDD